MTGTELYLHLLVVELHLGEHLPPFQSLLQQALIMVFSGCHHGIVLLLQAIFPGLHG